MPWSDDVMRPMPRACQPAALRLGPSRQHRFRTCPSFDASARARLLECSTVARIITSSAFENFIMACILMQLCILMMARACRAVGPRGSASRATTR